MLSNFWSALNQARSGLGPANVKKRVEVIYKPKFETFTSHEAYNIVEYLPKLAPVPDAKRV
jgi:hypothetical protein